MRSHTFLNISLGILSLGLGYHLGATNATAQASVSGLSVAWEGVPMAANAQGDVFEWPFGCGNCPPVWSFKGNVFGGSPNGRTIVQLAERLALASSGEVFMDMGMRGSGPWVNLGVPPSSPTAAERTSFGELKVRYRGAREPQGVKPSTSR